MSRTELINNSHDGTSIYELLLQILSDKGVCALIATGEEDRIIKVNQLICNDLNKKASDILGDSVENVLGELIESGIEVESQLAEKNGVVCKVITYSSYDSGINAVNSEERTLMKEILRQNMFYRGIVESVPDAVLTIDKNGTVTTWNKAAVDLFGWTIEEAIGQPLDDLVNTGTGEGEIHSGAVISGQVIRGLECSRRGKNGKEKKVLVSVAPRIIDGENQGAVGVYTDLSDRESILELLRENEIKFRAITESAQDAVIIIDSDSRVTFFNSSAEQMFGYNRSQTLGKLLHKLIAPEAYWEMIEVGFSQFSKTGKGMMVGRVVEIEGRRKNGTVFPVELSVSSFFLNGGWQATGILRDISERKRIELELIEAREGALNATRTKSEFLANMSHEIRTPLNAIIGTTDLMMETDLTSIQKSYLRVNRNASDNLLKLIDDILDISRVEAGRIELEKIPFDLYEDVEKTCETLAARAHGKGLELNCRIHPDTPVWVVGDPSRLKQVIINLIGNAIKFTDKGEISVEIKASGEDEISFSVTDTGIGIPEGKLEAIFMSFTQADSTHTRRYGGTGLGLAICTKLVELMGGEISVESEVGSGSSFTFFCKLPETDSFDLADKPHPPALSGKRVLVVDDNKGSRTILKEFLENWGASVDQAYSGIQALGMVRDTEYDVILLDYMMPEMGGYETVDNMQRDSVSTDSVIMMLTCNDSNSQIEKCRLSGIDRFIFKPVRRESLINQILSLLSGAVLPDEVDSFSAQRRTSIEKMHLSVLLAEDSPDNRFLIMKYTEAFPWKITVAENGQEALDHYLHEKFDLILMDMQMPVMDGYEATRSIRAHESISMGEHIPIVALTAHALCEEVKKCLDAGCDIHISKPVRKRNLVEKLDELLKIMGPREGVPVLAVDRRKTPIEELEPLENAKEFTDDKDQGLIAFVPEDLEPLIPGYLENRRRDVVKIQELVHNGDYAEAQRLAHSMKGSGGGYGFDKITQLGAAMEIAARSQKSADILSGVDELKIYLDTVRIEYVDEE